MFFGNIHTIINFSTNFILCHSVIYLPAWICVYDIREKQALLQQYSLDTCKSLDYLLQGECCYYGYACCDRNQRCVDNERCEPRERDIVPYWINGTLSQLNTTCSILSNLHHYFRQLYKYAVALLFKMSMNNVHALYVEEICDSFWVYVFAIQISSEYFANDVQHAPIWLR